MPKCRFFATTRDELIECGALVRGMRHGELDRLQIPEAPLDVLAQQIVAACAADDWQEDDLFALVRGAFPYRNLPRKDFDEIVAMLSDGIAARRGRYGAYLHRDQVNHRLHGRRGARLAAITSGGAIPDNALYTVIAEPEGVVIGTVDEDFAVESLRGDIILLGNSSWRIRRVQSGSVLVEDAHGAPPNIPFWLGEAPSRTSELSEQVAEIRERVNQLTAAAQHSVATGDNVPRLGSAGVPAGILRPPTQQTPSPTAEENLNCSQSSSCEGSTAEAAPQSLSTAITFLRDECGMDSGRRRANRRIHHRRPLRAPRRSHQTNHHRRAFLRRSRRNAA